MTPPVNQIHDVGKLIREAVAQGWAYYPEGAFMAFFHEHRVVRLRAIVRSWEELAEHRRALGFPATVEAIHG